MLFIFNNGADYIATYAWFKFTISCYYKFSRDRKNQIDPTKISAQPHRVVYILENAVYRIMTKGIADFRIVLIVAKAFVSRIVNAQSLLCDNP